MPSLKTPELGPDIVLGGRETNGTIALRVVYKEPLFSSSRMRTFTRQFTRLASQAVEEPDKAIIDYAVDEPEEPAASASAAVA